MNYNINPNRLKYLEKRYLEVTTKEFMMETGFTYYDTIKLFGKRYKCQKQKSCIDIIRPYYTAFRKGEITLSEYEEFLKSVNFIY